MFWWWWRKELALPFIRCVYHGQDRLADIWDLADDFSARSADELSLVKGDIVELIERDDDFGDGWYLGKHVKNGSSGLFPQGKR